MAGTQSSSSSFSCPDPINTLSLAIPGQRLASTDPIVAVSITNPGHPLTITDPVDSIPNQPLAISDHVAAVSGAIPSQSLVITDGSLSSRRPPPPCWTHEEIIALIDCYGEKWYSLGRRSLRAVHWDEVAVAISHRCPVETPKTSIQCRYKMEKLRRRLRSEKERSLVRFPSAKPQSYWVYFSKMDAMEQGSPNSSHLSPVVVPPVVNVKEYDVVSNCRGTTLSANCEGALGFKEPKAYGSKFDGMKLSKLDESGVDGRGAWLRGSATTSRSHGGLGGMKRSLNKKRGREEEESCEEKEERKDIFGVLASVMEKFTDCYLRMEQKKMAMEKEREKMWMEMEQKKTELFLDYHRRMIESLDNVFPGKKKKMDYGSR